MSLHFYNRQGKPIPMLDWCDLMEDRKYCEVAHEWIIEYTVRVSTIWRGGPFSSFSVLGMAPVFETIIFDNDDIVEQFSYVTEEMAIAGHDQAVALARDRYLPR